MIAQRIIVAIGPVATPYPLQNPPQGIVTVSLAGPMPYNPGDAPPDDAEFYDAIVAPDYTLPARYVYHAVMDDDGTVQVLRDQFGPGDFPHTYAGWPIPGN
jgi:hypothetical protein